MSMQRLSGRALVVQITEREIRIAQMTLGSDVISERVILPTPPNAVEDGQPRGLQDTDGKIFALLATFNTVHTHHDGQLAVVVPSSAQNCG